MKSFVSLQFLLLLFNVQFTNAQISEDGTPISSKNTSCLPQNAIQSIYFPSVNNDLLLRDDSIANIDDSLKTLNFGITLQANYGINNAGTWEILTDSSKLWRLKLVSQTAYSCFLIFDSFYIPKGATLFAYNDNKSKILGAFTSKNNKSDGRFSLGPIIGNTVILEYYEPKTIYSSPMINVLAFIHTFKNIFHYQEKSNLNTSATCNKNVMCPDADGWCNQIRSVALVYALNSTTGAPTGTFSGALINNEKRDNFPFFLTANHNYYQAQQEGSNPSDWIFYFNYQSPDCSNPTSELPMTYSISGSILLANHGFSDFALLALSSKPPGNFNTFYSGWTNENVQPDKNGVCIHHPKGDIKKISFYINKPTRHDNCNAKCWRVKWDKGITESGSSGSPLFNPQGLIVGQMDCGGSACGGSGYDNFGRFAKSWDAEPGNDNQLKPWLSPNSSSSLYIQAIGGDEPCKDSYYFENANDLHTSSNVDGVHFTGPFPGTRSYDGNYMASGLIQTGPNVTIQSGTNVAFYGKNINLAPGFTAEFGCSFVASPQPCLSGCITGGAKTIVNNIENGSEFIVLTTGQNEQDDEEIENTNALLVTNVINANNIILYPNPSNGIIAIEYKNAILKNCMLEVINLLGNIVYTQNLNVLQLQSINLNLLANGMYYVRVSNKEQSYSNKIIIQK